MQINQKYDTLLSMLLRREGLQSMPKQKRGASSQKKTQKLQISTNSPSVAEKNSQFILQSDGQYSFIPEIPEMIQKAHGPVVDRLLSETADIESAVLIDDETESTPRPLPIQTRVMLDYEGLDVDTIGNMRITAFDREVIDAVASLMNYNSFITSEMIFRVIMGKRNARYISDHQCDLIRDSLMRCSHARLHISVTDLTEKGSPIGRQLRALGFQKEYTGPVLAFEVVREINPKNGKMIDFYRILSQPTIFRYAASLGKVSKFPIWLLDTSVSKTVKVIVLQSFLLRSIDSMYRNGDQQFIDAKRIYESVNAQHDTDQVKARIRKHTKTILSDWIEKGFISGFQLHMAGNKIKGYDIMLNQFNNYPALELPEKTE